MTKEILTEIPLESTKSDTQVLFDVEEHQMELTESVITNAQGQEEKHFYIRGKFATIGIKNRNGRTYPRNLWEREVQKYQDVISSGSVNTLMEWEHPENRLKVDPKKAVGKITKLWIEGDFVMGEAVIFDTQESEIIKNMIKHGVKISVSSRAKGSVGAGGVVQTFELITFDIVTEPSDFSATMSGVFESFDEDAIEEFSVNPEVSNKVSILQTKNQEIRDLKEEIDILKESIKNQIRKNAIEIIKKF